MASNGTVDRILETVASLAPEIRAGLPGRRTGEVAAGENPTGDEQLAADLYADELLAEALLAIDGVGTYASEERPDTVGDGDGRYHVALDPLDGSSNLRSNNPMGTVLAVYDEPLPAPGSALVASGFVLYGPVTTMTVARDGRVVESLVDEAGDREVVQENLRLPAEPTVYGFGGRVPDWPDDFRAYVREVESDPELKLRYGGAMIADVSQVLTYGGIFSYPGLVSAPDGKLRTLFEGVPIAHIVETAGGASSDGTGPLTEGTPERLHERTPVHVGNESLIERLEDALD